MVEPLKGVKLDQPWRGWFEALTTAMNAAANKVAGMTVGNVFVAKAGGDLDDSGVHIGDLATEGYVDTAVTRIPAEKYMTESEMSEAGLEEGARYGSFRIGLLTEDDYVFFDENGKLIFYGTAGIQLITPLNQATTPTMFAVLDATGNLKYRTRAQLINDLSVSTTADVYQWVSERFITENSLQEAGDEAPIILVSPNKTRFEVAVSDAGVLTAVAL